MAPRLKEAHLTERPRSTAAGVAKVVTGFLTVTWQVAVLLPSTVAAVIVAVPGATAVTLPQVSTVATDSSLLLQVMILFVAFSGRAFAPRLKCRPG